MFPLVIGGGLLVVIIILVILLTVYCMWQHRTRTRQEETNRPVTNPIYRQTRLSTTGIYRYKGLILVYNWYRYKGLILVYNWYRYKGLILVYNWYTVEPLYNELVGTSVIVLNNYGGLLITEIE